MDRIDFEMTTDGDLVVSPSGDLSLVKGDDAIMQAVMFRLKTTRGDWLLSPNVGGDLETYIGQRMDPKTLNQIKSSIILELNQIKEYNAFEVSVAPKGQTSLWILVEFASTDIPSAEKSLFFDFDLKTGEINARSEQ